MAKTIKNTPKTQQEVTRDKIDPYLQDGKPPKEVPRIRGNDVSLRSDDDIKDIHIGFEDIIEGIMYYFREVIKPTVIENGTKVNIPVIYAEPERWKSAQNDGDFRDKDGQILLPVIALKLDNIDKDREATNKLDGNKVHNYQVFEKRYTKKNAYDNFGAIFNRKPVKEFASIVVPDYYKLTYSCIVYTSYMTDILKLIEQIGFRADSYWGQPNKFLFKARIDSYPITQELNQGEERKFMSIFNIVLNGYIIPDNIDRYLASDYQRFFSRCQITFKSEFIDGSDAGQQVCASHKTQAVKTIYKIPMDAIIYLNTNKAKVATSIPSGYVAVFDDASFLPAPPGVGLPETNKDSFSYWVNGQLIEYYGIVLFQDNGDGTCTLVIDPDEVGFTFEETDEIIAIGKFV